MIHMEELFSYEKWNFLARDTSFVDSDGNIADITNPTNYSQTITDDNSGQTFYGNLCTDSCHKKINANTHQANYGLHFPNFHEFHHHQGNYNIFIAYNISYTKNKNTLILLFIENWEK